MNYFRIRKIPHHQKKTNRLTERNSLFSHVMTNRGKCLEKSRFLGICHYQTFLIQLRLSGFNLDLVRTYLGFLVLSWWWSVTYWPRFQLRVWCTEYNSRYLIVTLRYICITDTRSFSGEMSVLHIFPFQSCWNFRVFWSIWNVCCHMTCPRHTQKVPRNPLEWSRL